MSARNFDQLISDKIVERLRALGNPNTTFLIDPGRNAERIRFTNAVADELARDAQITSRKLTTVPASFGTTDAALVLYEERLNTDPRGIFQKLEKAADVKYIVAVNAHYEPHDLKGNFEIISEDKVTFGTTRPNTASGRIQVLERKRVFV